MVVKYPCKICHKTIGKRHKAIRCSNCDERIHIKCNNLDIKAYNKLIEDPKPWYCQVCVDSMIPFSKLTDNEFDSIQSGKRFCLNRNSEINNCPQHLKDLFKNLNNINSAVNCKYFDVDDLIKLRHDKKGLSSYIHMNIASLPCHIDELRNLINNIESDIDVIGITESSLKQCDTNITDVNIKGYAIEHTPTEAKKGGSLLYINSIHNYKSREDLQIYKPKELESVFIEIIKEERKKHYSWMYISPSLYVCVRF